MDHVIVNQGVDVTVYNRYLTGDGYGRKRLLAAINLMLSFWLLITGSTVFAATSSITEFHLQHADILNPFSDEEHRTTILTYQNATRWEYGGSFFFIDYFSDSEQDGFNDRDYYGELYLDFSLGKISGHSLGYGALKDVGVIAGLNASGDANVRKYLPGIRLYWDVPGFIFFNSDITAYIDDNGGVSSGGAPREDNSWMLDFSFLAPFSIGSQKFMLAGHIERIAERDKDTGGRTRTWILAQPQLRWDIGHALFGEDNRLFVGIEYQYWRNKLGTDNDESVAQLLLVWRP